MLNLFKAQGVQYLVIETFKYSRQVYLTWKKFFKTNKKNKI